MPTGFPSPPKPPDTPPSFQPPQPQPNSAPPVTKHAAKSPAPPAPPKPPSPSKPPSQPKQAKAPTSSPGVSDTSGSSSQQTAGAPVNGATKPDDSSLYAILGVAEGAALPEIRAAYRPLAETTASLRFYIDPNSQRCERSSSSANRIQTSSERRRPRRGRPSQSASRRPGCVDAFFICGRTFTAGEVNNAFDVLSDPAKKQAYDLRGRDWRHVMSAPPWQHRAVRVLAGGLAGLAEFEFDGERIIMPPPWRVRH